MPPSSCPRPREAAASVPSPEAQQITMGNRTIEEASRLARLRRGSPSAVKMIETIENIIGESLQGPDKPVLRSGFPPSPEETQFAMGTAADIDRIPRNTN